MHYNLLDRAMMVAPVEVGLDAKKIQAIFSNSLGATISTAQSHHIEIVVSEAKGQG